MTISKSIECLELRNAVINCNAQEKLALLKLLESELFPTRFKQLLNQLKTNDLSLE